jgi:hypothetical protein
METFETSRSDTGGGPPPPGPPDDATETRTHAPKPRGTASLHLRSTRGGGGSAAGSTPKNTYRPSTARRARPAGKKPDGGGH